MMDKKEKVNPAETMQDDNKIERISIKERFINWSVKHPKFSKLMLFLLPFLGALATAYINNTNAGKGSSFQDWVESASDEELKALYEEHRLTVYKQTGRETYEMNKIDQELYKRGQIKWDKDHSEVKKSGQRWTDKARWE